MGTFQQSHLYSAISFPVPCLVCFSSSGSCHCNEQEQLWFPVSAGHQHASHHTSKGKNNLTRSITSVTTEHQPSLKYSAWTVSNWSSTMQENCSCPTSQRGEEASDQFPVLQTAKLHKTVFKTGFVCCKIYCLSGCIQDHPVKIPTAQKRSTPKEKEPPPS